MTRNLNEEFLSVLSDYDGTIDDRRKKFLVENYGFSDNRSVATMEYEVLGDLGYTGTIDDRWGKYLTNLGGVGLSAKATLLSSTFYLGYSVVGIAPSLSTDFENQKYIVDKNFTDFDGAVTHSRASTATYVDANGILQTAAVDEPRVGHHIYDPATETWVNEGILHESEARTNVLLDSGDPTTANWEIRTTTATKNAVGLGGVANTAWTLEDDSASVYETNAQSITIPDDTNTHTAQFFIRKDNDETRFPRFYVDLIDGTTAALHRVEINTKTGSKNVSTNTASDTSFVEDWGNFWRVIISVTNNGTGNTRLRTTIAPAIATTIAGQDASATGSIVYAGGQVELNTSTPSSYIPTAGSQVTRAADSMTVPAAKLPYSSTNMSIAMEGRMTYADNNSNSEAYLVYWVDAGFSNFITQQISTDAGGSGSPRFGQREGGTTADIVDGSINYYTPGINVPFSVASRHGSTFINGAVDGTALTANTTPTALPDLSATDLDLGRNFMGTIRLFRMWNDDLGNSGIEEASDLEPSSFLLWDATADTYTQRIYS